MTRQHIMLDIETLDTTARAVVISIGAVAFTFDGGQQNFPYYRALAYDDQLALGRKVSQDTLHFWSQQSDEARGAAFNGTRTDTEEALHELGAFISTRGHNVENIINMDRSVEVEGPLIWAYPADFDLAIIEDLCADFGILVPWGHRDKRCARTLNSIAGNPPFKHKGHVMAHHPVSDCQVQITQARAAFDMIKSGTVIIA